MFKVNAKFNYLSVTSLFTFLTKYYKAKSLLLEIRMSTTQKKFVSSILFDTE